MSSSAVSISEAQLAANKANAQLSTGPRSPEAKARVAGNAVKTALTGRTVLLPTDDAVAYQTLLQDFIAECAPVGAQETALVQSIVDSRWRLDRIPALEAALLDIGLAELPQRQPNVDLSDSAKCEMLVRLHYQKQFRNLQLQESRLTRRREKETAVLAGFSSVMLVMLLGQSRVFFSMSEDGLIPRLFSDLHPKFRTPYKSNLVLYVFVALLGGFLPGDITGNMTNLGTLFAFVLVCFGVWIMRNKKPDQERPFRTPLVPLVPILGAIFCLAMIVTVDATSKISAGIWMLIGLAVYFLYAKSHSKLRESQKL